MKNESEDTASQGSTGAGGLKASAMARALMREGFEDVLILSAGENVLTPRRKELYTRIKEDRGECVSELAEALDRDTGAVSRDLDTLFEYDVVDFERDGPRKVPVQKYTDVVEVTLT